MSIMSKLKRLRQERNRSVKAFRPVKALILSTALALAGVAAVMTTAGPAYANPNPSISASGGAGWLSLTGGPFDSGAIVRISVLSNPGLKTVGGTEYPSQYIHADGSGYITAAFNVMSGTLSRAYSGPVYVLADQVSPTPSFGTVGAQTVVNPPPQFLINGTGQPSCGSGVNANGTGFDRFSHVRVELLSQDLTKLLNGGKAVPISTDYVGDFGLGPSPADAGPALTTTDSSGNPYTGWAWIVADESTGGPAWTEAWYHLYVC